MWPTLQALGIWLSWMVEDLNEVCVMAGGFMALLRLVQCAIFVTASATALILFHLPIELNFHATCKFRS